MIILIDIGGTNTRVATWNGETLSLPLRRSTPSRFAEGHDLVRTLIRDSVRGGDELERVVIGMRGTLAPDGSRIADDDVLLNWINKPLGFLLQTEFKVPVSLVSGAVLAHASEAGNVLYMNIGTTVTAVAPRAFMIDGEVVDTLSDLVGGRAVQERFGVPPYALPVDHHVWKRAADFIAHSIVRLHTVTGADTVVLGGRMVLGTPAISITDIVSAVHTLVGPDDAPTIVPARHGEESVLRGALAYALREA